MDIRTENKVLDAEAPVENSIHSFVKADRCEEPSTFNNLKPLEEDLTPALHQRFKKSEISSLPRKKKKLVCNHCHKKFHRKRALIDHVRKHLKFGPRNISSRSIVENPYITSQVDETNTSEDNHRKYLNSFYSACNVLIKNSEDKLRSRICANDFSVPRDFEPSYWQQQAADNGIPWRRNRFSQNVHENYEPLIKESKKVMFFSQQINKSVPLLLATQLNAIEERKSQLGYDEFQYSVMNCNRIFSLKSDEEANICGISQPLTFHKNSTNYVDTAGTSAVECLSKDDKSLFIKNRENDYPNEIFSSTNTKEERKLGPTNFICHNCSHRFQLKSKMRKHIKKCTMIAGRKKHREEEVMCSNCGRKFPQKASLSRHIASNSCKVICNVCGYIPRKPCELKRHMVKHTGERISCPHCYKKFIRPYMLTQHLTEHKFSVHKCSECTKKCVGQKELLEHIETFHKRVCKECDLSFPTAKQLKRHLRGNIHKNGEFFCKVCGVCLNKKDDFEQHMNKHSVAPEKMKPYVCERCQKRFVKPYSLKNHLSMCDRLGRKDCSKCGKKFLSSYALERHINGKMHDKDRYFCNSCKIYFTVEKNFKRHVAKHSLPLHKIKPFACKYCTKRFFKRKSLRLHVNLHISDGTCECAHCGRKFSQKSSLKRHIKMCY